MKKTKETRTLFVKRYLNVLNTDDVGMVANFFSWFISTFLKMIDPDHELYNSIYEISYSGFRIQCEKCEKWFELLEWDIIDKTYIDGDFSKFTIGNFTVVMEND